MCIQKRLDDLFERWKETHKALPQREDLPILEIFLPDGIAGIDTTIYENTNPRVLYILKESNVKNGYINDYFWFRDSQVEKYGNHRIANRIWLMQEVVTKGILHDKVLPSKSNDLRAVAYMNLNKCGGDSMVNYTKLKNYIDIPEIREYILDEIRILAPDIIICCGSDIMNIVKELASCIGLYEHIVFTKHPSCWGSDIKFIEEFYTEWSKSECKKKLYS